MDRMTQDNHTAELHRTPRRSERLRQRAAWMYFVEEMTQSAIADALGVGRVTVVRMLAEAKALGEVRITLARGNAELGGLEAALCKAYRFEEALVAPLSSPSADATAPISAALGDYVSQLLRNEMKIGLGWGRTLNRSLEYLRERSLKGLSVVSLVGGVTHFAENNPAEFPSAFARAFNADCYLIPAPALVDSPATKTALIERCGLGAVYAFANALDAIVVSVGSLGHRGDDLPFRADRRGRPAADARIWRGRRVAVQRLRQGGPARRPSAQPAGDVGPDGGRARRADPGAGRRRRPQARRHRRGDQASQADDAGDRRGDRAQADRAIRLALRLREERERRSNPCRRARRIRHCEERSDEAIHAAEPNHGLLRPSGPRNDG